MGCRLVWVAICSGSSARPIATVQCGGVGATTFHTKINRLTVRDADSGMLRGEQRGTSLPSVTTGLIFDKSIGIELDTFAGPRGLCDPSVVRMDVG